VYSHRNLLDALFQSDGRSGVVHGHEFFTIDTPAARKPSLS
jgi:hypothetical protein